MTKLKTTIHQLSPIIALIIFGVLHAAEPLDGILDPLRVAKLSLMSV